MVGMGGSQLYIPILFWMGMDFKTQAIPLGLLMNIVNSTSAAWIYGRKKMIDWRIAWPFGAAMVVFAPVGTLVNLNLPTEPIILTFAFFTAGGAGLILSGWRPQKGGFSKKEKLIMSLSAGVVLGFFTGLIGRGGGSFIVPLLYISGLGEKVAAATSLVIVALSGSSSFLSHLFTAAQPDWQVWGLCLLAVFLGGQAGSRLMIKKLNPKSIRMIFGVVLLAVAAVLIVKDIVFT